ncbi:MAG: glyoxalase [Robiginitomaculum sp.]|nr:MAG: glyoxalase [Robiginitomaculum sp.]
MRNLKSVEIKAFIPCKDFELSKSFYQDMGFTKGWDSDGMAYFHHRNCSFLLQDFYVADHANNFMMHLLVEDVDAWFRKVMSSGLGEKYNVKITQVEDQPWGMRDFVVIDPTGVLWRIGQNI